MILDMTGKEMKRVPVKGEKPGVGTRFIINGHVFKIVFVKHNPKGDYLRFTAEYCYEDCR